jgi:hypothetical protein
VVSETWGHRFVESPQKRDDTRGELAFVVIERLGEGGREEIFVGEWEVDIADNEIGFHMLPGGEPDAGGFELCFGFLLGGGADCRGGGGGQRGKGYLLGAHCRGGGAGGGQRGKGCLLLFFFCASRPFLLLSFLLFFLFLDKDLGYRAVEHALDAVRFGQSQEFSTYLEERKEGRKEGGKEGGREGGTEFNLV